MTEPEKSDIGPCVIVFYKPGTLETSGFIWDLPVGPFETFSAASDYARTTWGADSPRYRRCYYSRLSTPEQGAQYDNQ